MLSTRYDETEKLWCGSDILPLYNPIMNLAQAFLHSMSVFGSKIAQVSENKYKLKKTFYENDKITLKFIRLAMTVAFR